MIRLLLNIILAVTGCPSFDLVISTAIGLERGRLQICHVMRS